MLESSLAPICLSTSLYKPSSLEEFHVLLYPLTFFTFPLVESQLGFLLYRSNEIDPVKL